MGSAAVVFGMKLFRGRVIDGCSYDLAALAVRPTMGAAETGNQRKPQAAGGRVATKIRGGRPARGGIADFQQPQAIGDHDLDVYGCRPCRRALETSSSNISSRCTASSATSGGRAPSCKAAPSWGRAAGHPGECDRLPGAHQFGVHRLGRQLLAQPCTIAHESTSLTSGPRVTVEQPEVVIKAA